MSSAINSGKFDRDELIKIVKQEVSDEYVDSYVKDFEFYTKLKKLPNEAVSKLDALQAEPIVLD